MQSRQSFHEHYNSSTKPPRSDAETDAELRGRMMAADPMYEYFRQKEREKQGTTGEPSKPVYRGPCPPNRFDIRPGHRWDGVDRSNGYEKKFLEKEVTKKASEEEAYRDATRDM